jgi:predicted  nucleic acid-binding Zn-ribbon protein
MPDDSHTAENGRGRKGIQGLQAKVKKLKRQISRHERNVSRFEHKIDLIASERLPTPPFPTLDETSTPQI